MSITHRERALAALNHEEPDRVSLDLGSTRNSGILVEAYEALAHYLAGEATGDGDGGVAVARDDFGQSKIAGVATPSECVLQRLGIDFRGIYLGKPDQSMEAMLPNGDYRDELGVVRRRPPSSYYWDVVHSPFSGDASLDDVRNWDWPDPADPGYTRGMREKALDLRNSSDCALVLHLTDIVVHPVQFLLGFEKWFMSFIQDPELLGCLMDVVLDLRSSVTAAALEQVGDLIDVISCSDDVAGMQSTLVSPAMYREFIKPRHQQYFDLIRSYTPAKLLYHSCGAVTEIIPDFIELGIDFINPVQVSAAGMDTARLKEEFGAEIGFWGSVDTMRVLPFGTEDEVRAEVKERVRDLAPGGGFVVAAVHNIQPNVPPQNIVAMFDAAREYGTYPITA